MRVLLTGHTGFVGKNVLQYLDKNTDWSILTSDANYARHFVQDEEGFDVILNLASISSVEYSIQEPVEVIENNIMITTQLLEYARQHPPKLFIQFSTIETNNVTNPYAASKKAQEAIAKAYSHTYDIPVVVIHSTNIIGAGQNPEKFVPKLIQQIKANEPVTIYTVNGEVGYRYYNPVYNVADVIKHIIVDCEQYTGYSEVGLSGYRASNLDIANTIAIMLKKRKQAAFELVEAEQVRPGYLADYDIENSFAHIKPVQSLKECLTELTK